MRRVARGTDTTPAVLTIRVPAALRDRIDDVLTRRAIKIPRNTWVLEAVCEKLAREMTTKERGHGSR